MTEHLPECHQTKYLNQVMWGSISRDEPFVPCICDVLRACEARVRESEACLAVCADRNYMRGLDAAREAVVVLCWRKQYEGFVSTVDPQRVLAAIDALKEEQ